MSHFNKKLYISPTMRRSFGRAWENPHSIRNNQQLSLIVLLIGLELINN